MKTWPILTTHRIHGDTETTLPWIDFLRRALPITGGRSDDEAYHFYSDPEHWYLLPQADGAGEPIVDIVFSEARGIYEFKEYMDILRRTLAGEWRESKVFRTDGFLYNQLVTIVPKSVCT